MSKDLSPGRKAGGLLKISVVAAFAAVFLLEGGYFEYASCFALLIFCPVLSVAVFKGGRRLKLTEVRIAALVMAAAYLAVCLWAVDRGMALIGFFKYLPFAVFLFLPDLLEIKREKIIAFLPYFGSLLAIGSAAFSRVDSLKPYLVVNGRLAGPFEYPNTFAAFLLVCLIVCSFGRSIYSLINALVLLSGIYMSGSLSVIILTGISFLLFPLVHKDIRKKLVLAYVPLVIAAVVLVAISGRLSGMELKNSTFIGRFLYWRDSLALIIKHPFGLGHYGYFYTQGTVQTGVYSLRYIHNGFLQMVLDIGILPAVFFFFVYVKTAVKSGSVRNTFVLFVLLAHVLFDYDLSYISMWLLMALFLEKDAEVKNETEADVKKEGRKTGSGKKKSAGKMARYGGNAGYGKNAGNGKHERQGKPDVHGNFLILKLGIVITALLIIAFAVIIGLSSLYYKLGKYDKAERIYLGNTEAKLYVLTVTEDRSAKLRIAEEVISGNKYADYAYKVRADINFKNGLMDGYISDMKRAIELRPYDSEYYLNYFDVLYAATEYFLEQGEKENAKYCYGKLAEIPEMLAELDDRTSALGRAIRDVPMTELPEEYQKRLGTIKKYI